jgi:S1-C subfamily serine protease
MFRRLWMIPLLSGLPAAVTSCGPPAPAPAEVATAAVDGAELDGGALLEALERRVAESIGRLRESAVALEYAALDAPSDVRRVATGVVVNDRGDVLSVRIDSPPSEAPIVARDAVGGRHPVRWIASDVDTGLTLLRIDPGVARPVQAAGRRPRLGSQVLVIGNPFGLGHSVIRGQVAGLDRRVDVGPRPLGRLIQVDAALHPGDSGALVGNLSGEWLGLIRSGLAIPGAEHAVDHDLGFAVTAHDALWIAEQLGIHHRVDRAYLGVRFHPDEAGSSRGALLGGVVDDTPAARAGLREGDRVVAFEGHPIESPGDLTDWLDRTLAHTDATLDYLRGSKRDRLTLRTARRPPPAHHVRVTPARARTVEGDSPAAPSREFTERIEGLERRLRRLEKESPKE